MRSFKFIATGLIVATAALAATGLFASSTSAVTSGPVVAAAGGGSYIIPVSSLPCAVANNFGYGWMGSGPRICDFPPVYSVKSGRYQSFVWRHESAAIWTNNGWAPLSVKVPLQYVDCRIDCGPLTEISMVWRDPATGQQISWIGASNGADEIQVPQGFYFKLVTDLYFFDGHNWIPSETVQQYDPSGQATSMVIAGWRYI